MIGISLRAIDDLNVQWRNREVQLTRWREVLEARSSELDTARDSLESIRSAWESTAESAADQDLPPATIETIQSVLEHVSGVENTLGERRQRILTLLSQVSQSSSIVAQAQVDVATAYGSARRRILTPDSPPLWRGLRSRTDSLSLIQHLRDSWEQKTASLREFSSRQHQPIIAYVVLFVLLLIGLVGLRRSSRRWGVDDAALQASAHILSRPVSTALLLTLASTRLFFPLAPTVVVNVAQVLWIIPLLRLIPGVLDPTMRLSAFGALALWEFLKVGDLLIDQPLAMRGVLLLICALALAGLAVLLKRNSWLRQHYPVKWWWAVVPIARLGLFWMAVSILANVLGFVRLSWILTEGVLTAGAAALGIIVLVKAIDGIVAVLLKRGPARWLRSVGYSSGVLSRRISGIVHAGALALWFFAVLRAFEIIDPILHTIVLVLGREWALGSWQISLGDILAFVLTLWLAIWISRGIRLLLREDVLPKMDLPRGVPTTISALVHYFVLIVGFLFAAGAAGFDLSSITLLAGAFGVGIGFGLQNIVNNFISGLILMFERPIQIGDTIEVDGLIGEVRQIGIRASTVRTFECAEVIVPNGDLISGRVINWTLSDKLRRVEVPVGVKYGTDPKQVLEILVAAAKQHDDVLENPEPYALFVEFGDSSLNFVLRFWTSNFDFWRRVMSDVTVAVNSELASAGIEIPFPQRDLHLKSVEEPAARALKDKSTAKK
jgi:small-conductance mechanosensitive channel